MIIKSYFNKSNTIIVSDYTNTGRNPVAELFYGGPSGENYYSRYLFNFDTTRLIGLYTGGTFPDLTKLKHTLRLTNTGSFDKSLLNNQFQTFDRTSSFDLIAFKINQDWDEGVGYDYQNASNIIIGEGAISTQPSNWIYAQTGIYWDNGPGVYSGSPSGVTIATQHFDAGNENIEMDISAYVNGVLTGDTNYGLGIAFGYPFELTSTLNIQYVGFFTRHTQTFYEPYIETQYQNYINDARNTFYLDTPNELYLYVNIGGYPTNLDVLPTVTVYDNNNVIYSAYTSSAVTWVTKGVYKIGLFIPTNSDFSEGQLLNDVWGGIILNGVSRPDITLAFELQTSFGYYNIGSDDSSPKPVNVSVSGIYNQEIIRRGDIRKLNVLTKIPYTVDQTQNIDNIAITLYVLEGQKQVIVVDKEPMEQTANFNYFLLDTQSLLPNDYYLNVTVITNQEVLTLTNVIVFTIVSQSNDRISQ